MPAEDIDSVMDKHFGDEKETPEVVVEEKSEEAPEVVEEEVESEEEQETDYEADLPEEKTKEEEPEPKDESHARRRAKEEGKLRKQLEVTVREKDLELDRLREEVETLKGKTTELEAVRIKPEEHPDFLALQNKIINEAKDTVDEFDAPHANVVFNKLGSFIRDYRKADSSENRETALLALKDDLAAKMFGEDSTFESLEKDDRKEVSAALRLIKKSTEKADELDALGKDLEKKAKTGTLAVGVREYEALSKEFSPIVDAVGDLPDDVLETTPHTLESQVAILAKTEAGKKRLNDAKRDALDIVMGLRPLTQAEIGKLEANGTDIKAYLAERQKALVEKKKKLLPIFIQALAGKAITNKAFVELANLKGKVESEESEDDVIRKVTKKKPVVKDEPKRPRTAADVFAKHGLDD